MSSRRTSISRAAFKWTNTITPSQVEQLIRSEKDLNKAILIFDSATAEYRNGYRHDHTTFGLLISRLVSANQFGPAEALLARMKHEDKCEMKEDIFLSLFRGYGRIHRPLDALRIFRKMTSNFHFKPTSRSYITIFSILVDQNDLKLAFRFYRYMKQMGVPLVLASINILLKALCKNANTMPSALRMFREMPRRGFTPDSYTYGTLINGLCRLGKLKDATKLFKEMERNGCSPSVVTYTSLINGLCHHGNRFDEALKLLAEMTSKGIAPNVFTYSSLIDGFCKAGQSSDAMELFYRMTGKGHSPNMVTYSSLMHGLCKEGKIREALEIVDRMKVQGLKPDAGLYGKIITGLCDVCKFQEAANLLDEMVLEGISPNRLTWSIHVQVHNKVIQGLCSSANGSLDRAFQLYLSVRTRGITIDHSTHETLVKCHCKNGDLLKAARIIDEMVIDGCVPDEQTWRFVVDGFWDHKEVREATQALMAELMSSFEF